MTIFLRLLLSGGIRRSGRNYFRPYLSIILPACAIEVQHINENSPTIFIDMFAPKWARGPHNLARFPSWDPCITPGY